MYSFGSSGGLRERRFSLKSTFSRAILQGARFIVYAYLALQATLFAYRTRFRFSYAGPIKCNCSMPLVLSPNLCSPSPKEDADLREMAFGTWERAHTLRYWRMRQHGCSAGSLIPLISALPGRETVTQLHEHVVWALERWHRRKRCCGRYMAV